MPTVEVAGLAQGDTAVVVQVYAILTMLGRGAILEHRNAITMTVRPIHVKMEEYAQILALISIGVPVRMAGREKGAPYHL